MKKKISQHYMHMKDKARVSVPTKGMQILLKTISANALWYCLYLCLDNQHLYIHSHLWPYMDQSPYDL